MSDLTQYALARATRDPEFADGLESGYAEFKAGVLSLNLQPPRKSASPRK